MKGKTLPVSVVKVIDGDSLRLKRSGMLGIFSREFEVRMYGIDAPEYRQAMGPESRDALVKHMKGGQLIAEITAIDRYGRNVALIYHKKRGRRDSVNNAMVHSGYAHWYGRYGGKELGFDEAQKHAQQNSLGLWKNRNAQKPWDYRAEQRTGKGVPAFIKWFIVLSILGGAALVAAKATGLI